MNALERKNAVAPFSRTLLVFVAVAALLSGCADAPGVNAETVDAAQIVDGHDCLAPNLDSWFLPPDSTSTPDPAHPDAPEAGRVPDGFTPTTAVRCDGGGSIEDAEGLWSGVTAITFTGDLAPLVAALAEPDDENWPGPCTADMEIVPPLWLVDATGRAIHAHYPLTGCGKTKPGVRDALAELTVHDTTTLKRTLVEPRAALDSGCAAEWTAPFDSGWLLSSPSTTLVPNADGVTPFPNAPLTGPVPTVTVPTAPAPTATVPTVAVPTELDGMRWCRYEVEPAPSETPTSSGSEDFPGAIVLHTGQFTSGGTLDSGSAQAVADTAASEPALRSCDETATTFVVLWPTDGGRELGMSFTAELNGCELLYTDGGDSRPLPPSVRELLTAQTAL